GCEAYVHLLNRTEWNSVPSVIQLHGPIVMFAHALGWPEPDSEFYRVARLMEETCLRLADGIYSSSRCSADWCAKYYGLDTQSIPVLHTGVDTATFRPLPIPKQTRPTIAFVGRIERNKGVDRLVEAGCKLADEFPELRIQVIGRGSPKVVAELSRTANAAGHPDLIEFPGYISREELPEYLSRAHVFAAPSVYEGGPGFVYLEAMACGLPVIACQGSGAAEVIDDGETGFLVEPGNEKSLYQALARLLRDETLRNRMGRCARNYVEREANSEECLSRLESFYCHVVERCRRTPEHV
ncbi:MAG: glycosyltransferase family 4 protein, partial [Planctomycetes bacterium]|nr:glycosyltransferase family 4 protein [Planctomycetota bacterium]